MINLLVFRVWVIEMLTSVVGMTAPGLNEKNPHLVTWAGQEYYAGAPVGKYKEEVVRDGRVFVGASEAVLIFLDSEPGRYN